MEAKLLHGSPLMIDHTPSGAVSAGEVVLVGDRALVAHNDIGANSLGALAAGGGVYTVAKTASSGTAVAAGGVVYWDNSGNKGTATSGSNKVLGWAAAAAADSATTITVVHDPSL